MAGRLSLSEVDLSCPICCDVFRDPVVLKCSHSFCKLCLQQHWSTGRTRDCPMCRNQSVDDPIPSLTLKNLCESYLDERGEDQGETEREECCDPGELCPLHGEKFKLFCTQDNEPICVVCHTSKKHKQHDCCPVSEALADVKVNLREKTPGGTMI